MFMFLILLTGTIIFLFNGLPKLMSSTLLEEIQASGELIVLTRNSPTTYYEGAEGPTGLEYELASRFADDLGVSLKIIVPDTLGDLLDGITTGQAHIAAAGLTITEPRKNFFRFGPPYQEITEQLIYNINNKRPKNLSDLGNGTLEVVANSSHSERLAYLKIDYPNLNWKENSELESEELIQNVSDGILEYTIADSNEFILKKYFLLNIKAAFDISPPQQLAWGFQKNADDSLINAATEFFKKIEENGELTRLTERAYGHLEDFDYVGTILFRRHIAKKLPRYKKLFEEAASRHKLDWRLLAAMGYQESHWNPTATSPTGVRGIMMLTQRTAAQIGVKNRLDPKSSIIGGAQYFASRLESIPESIEEPDRTWMALAAYNVGFFHLEDARIITQKLGKDPNKWVDVKKSLPLLAKRKWYKNTKYGYARGWEPVRYVENIRSYYDILKWIDSKERPKEPEPDAFNKLPNVP